MERTPGGPGVEPGTFEVGIAWVRYHYTTTPVKVKESNVKLFSNKKFRFMNENIWENGTKNKLESNFFEFLHQLAAQFVHFFLWI